MRVRLWDAIHDWANAGAGTYGNISAQKAVVAVEKAVDDEVADLRAQLEHAKADVETLDEKLREAYRHEAEQNSEQGRLLIELNRTQAKLRIARAAGRRLGEYWRAQTSGAEGITEILIDNWRSKIGKALGLDMPLLSEQIETINKLKEEAAASRDGRARAEECLAKMMAECEAIVKDHYDVKEGSPEAAVEDAVQRIKAAGQLNKKGLVDGE